MKRLESYLKINGGEHILVEYNRQGMLCNRTRTDLVNLTVKIMINGYGTQIPKTIKTDFAKAIVSLMPKLKDPTSTK